ncbi:tyrosine-type recombinase/integrase [Streptomyces sp. NBC_01808]|uniref:site-specific integrase n=1 Tax=Streptomyces sp. NBC_01808 TaxID=2975947 RepID=UPI002DDA8041|nr:tyrosine-type recombinase/integrase [Streptomyces sp. NBC_01808]WSA41475.1 tyrosine-type recombinase/integrase [Streptomyces sp. NBC_01808]
MTETPKKGRKAANGEDSIYWDKSKNRFVGAVSLGYAPDGTRRRTKVYGKTRTEVRRKLRDLKRELDAGLKAPANLTVEQAVMSWLSNGLKGRDAESVKTYRSLASNHVIADLGKAKLRELEADELDAWLESKASVLAHESLKRVLAILRRSIRHAQRRGQVVRNVAELVELPEGQPGRPSKSLTLEQAHAVLRAKQGTWIHAYVVLALLVGVRTEEERPLTWAHVHTSSEGDARPYIDVWRSVRRKGDTKTRKSRRSLTMPYQAAAVLDAHRARQQEEYHAAGRTWSDDELVFPDPDGGPRTSTNVRRNLRSLLKDAGFPSPDEWTTRELRTSFVSLLSDHGMPIEVIARVVGHSGTNTTETVYRKQLRPVITEGAEAMDEILKPDRPKAPGRAADL